MVSGDTGGCRTVTMGLRPSMRRLRPGMIGRVNGRGHQLPTNLVDTLYLHRFRGEQEHSRGIRSLVPSSISWTGSIRRTAATHAAHDALLREADGVGPKSLQLEATVGRACPRMAERLC
jgi:hypothetical protein